MSGTWAESREGIVRLPEDSAATFHVYVHFLYTNEIAILADSDPKIPVRDTDNLRLARLYVLAENLQDVETKDQVLQAIIVAFHPATGNIFIPKLPTRAFVQIIYEGTPTGSLAHKLMVSMYARRAKGHWLKLEKASNRERWPEDFIHELLVDVMNQRPVLSGIIGANEANKHKEQQAKPSA